ncbi:two-component system cell cycle sensor histidine kinase/response regulator CckA [Aliiruegeria haliotis]|uniref:histidine kinase n=1 Tax=Aliiruegeria haliotis TaxID=1280846 RepID=A0A2T0S0M1_9RHOB|nr:ATP-binding protein [Aliiruegeria haliotis]PRY26981.1 two-component system cell cycle sensor histidine kinase/response regulator CckA [Aliiruegeria haliotis]
MSHPALAPHPVTRTAAAHSGRTLYLTLFSVVLVAAAFYVPDAKLGLALFAGGGTLLALAVLIRFFSTRHVAAKEDLGDAVSGFIENDGSPSFTTDVDGVIQQRNRAARERFGRDLGIEETLARTLREIFANPSAVLMRLQNRAEARGSAREDIVTRRGHVRLAVHMIGEERYLWRLEDLVERGPVGRGAEQLSLPMMTVSHSGAVLFMNDALRRLMGGRVKTLDRVFSDLPIRPNDTHVLNGIDGAVSVRVVEVEGAGGRREIFLIPDTTTDVAPTSSAIEDGSMDSLPVALLRLDRSGMIRGVNRAAADLLGEAAQEDGELHRLVEGLGRSVKDWLEEAASGRGLGRSEFVRASVGEKELYLQITLGRVKDGKDVDLIAVLNDATELKTLEAQFVQSQKMQAIGQLAGGIAHDFNNLLTAISGHCDLLLLRHDQGDQDYGDLVQINQNANRAASLVGQLLAFSRKQNLQPEVLDLRDTLSDLTHLLNRLVGEKVTLSLFHDPALRPIRADKRQLEQVIMNLVVNARDAMPNGGEIRLESESAHISQSFSRDRAVVAPGDYVIVKVVDMGVGIPPDKLAKIFEPFFTTKRTGEGTGLGLSTAYGIVKQTGGYIFVDSEVDKGTTVSLYFPAHDKAQSVEPVSRKSLPVNSLQQGDGVILLVEDEAPVRAFASRALRMRGYTVIEAESAEEALLTLEDNSLKVDVFVTDVIMPGMDGPSWVREALKQRPDVRVIFVSGYAEEHFSDEQSRIPNSVFLPKPFSLNELTATVRDQIH